MFVIEERSGNGWKRWKGGCVEKRESKAATHGSHQQHPLNSVGEPASSVVVTAQGGEEPFLDPCC
jgi:hypothetical protein